ncbi:MAG: carboxypeptidase-like regulatory domain-containing protein [Bacteroides sp.]|nr:carboxypeptidase-like regulatory domain-containing protein [Bacteroides sp.]
MKKFISICAAMLLGLGSMLAQENFKAVKGYVIDKNGNPIPGAEVMAPGGGESAITDSDGSFHMNVHPLLKKLSATYDGMTTKTLKIKPDKDLVFRLKKERVRPAFLNVVHAFSYNMHGYYDNSAPAWGIMAGMLGKWGFYGKGVSDWEGNFSVTFGVIKSIYKRTTYIYAGAGYGMADRESYYEYYNPRYNSHYNSTTGQYEYTGGWDHDWEYDYRPGIASDFGFIFKTGRHFNITIGYNIIRTFPFKGYNAATDRNDRTYGSNYVHGAQLGLGYVF